MRESANLLTSPFQQELERMASPDAEPSTTLLRSRVIERESTRRRVP